MVLTYFIKPKSSNVKKSLMWTNNSWIFRRHCTLLSSGTIYAYKKTNFKRADLIYELFLKHIKKWHGSKISWVYRLFRRTDDQFRLNHTWDGCNFAIQKSHSPWIFVTEFMSPWLLAGADSHTEHKLLVVIAATQNVLKQRSLCIFFKEVIFGDTFFGFSLV